MALTKKPKTAKNNAEGLLVLSKKDRLELRICRRRLSALENMFKFLSDLRKVETSASVKSKKRKRANKE